MFLQPEENAASGSSPAVFVSVLVAGLLLAAIIVGIYYFKCHRRTNGKGMKLVSVRLTEPKKNIPLIVISFLEDAITCSNSTLNKSLKKIYTFIHFLLSKPSNWWLHQRYLHQVFPIKFPFWMCCACILTAKFSVFDREMLPSS